MTNQQPQICTLKYTLPTRRAWRTAGDLNPLTAKTIATEGHWKRRKVREAIEVKLVQNNVNLDEGGIRLSPIWDILLT